MSTFIEINDSLYSVDEDTCVPNTIERIDPTVTYNEFFSKYLIPNKPCIINSQATENWPCRHEWVSDGIPNFNILRTLFGMCRDSNRNSYDEIINVIFIAQDTLLSQLLIVIENFTTRNSRMICP